MRVRWKSFVPLLGIFGIWLGSPEVKAVVGDKNYHILLAVSGLIAALMPALVTNKPPRDRVAERVQQRHEKAGLTVGEGEDPLAPRWYRPPTDAPHDIGGE